MRQKWMFYLLTGVLAVGGGIKLSGQQTVYAKETSTTEQEAVPEEAQEPDQATEEETLDAAAYVEILCGGDVKELEENYSYTEEFLSAMETAGGFEKLQESMQGLGELKKTGEPVVTEVSGYVVYSVPCEFASMNLNLAVTVDGQGKIAGVTTAEYQNPAEEADEQEAALPQGLTETELSLPVSGHEGWELPGTLTMPEGEGDFPAVVLVHGSGPNDRDETIGPNKVFRDLAWGLAEQGIAVFRYDKRTKVYGNELVTDTALTLDEETVNDTRDAVLLLRQQENIDPDRIYVLGHSLGGEALPRIDQALGEGEQAAGYIFLAAPARDLAELMREQYDFLFSLMPDPGEEVEAQKEAVYGELDKLEDLDSLAEDEPILGAYKAYWEDLKNYDPVKTAASITADCLVLQGEEDYQVTMEDYGLWKDAYEGRENWKFISYPGLTHLFMEGSLENGNADYMKAQNVKEQVITDIGTFVNS